jgi:hypothetical protein
MRKITFLLGAGIGFVAGSKAGHGPYRQLEAEVRKVTKRSEPPSDRYATVPTVVTDDAAADIVPLPDPPSREASDTLHSLTGAEAILPTGAGL